MFTSHFPYSPLFVSYLCLIISIIHLTAMFSRKWDCFIGVEDNRMEGDYDLSINNVAAEGQI